MNIRFNMKQAARIGFLLFMVCGLIILSTTSYAASIPSYDLVKQFPEDPRDYQQVFSPADVVFDPAGNQYVADGSQHMIIKYNAAGDYVTHWTVFGIRGLTLDPTLSHIYVGRTTDEIEVYDDSGSHLHTFGGSGAGDGEFTVISDIAIDDDYIYVADSGNHRVQIFRKSDRTFVTSVGGSGTGDGEFNNPSGLTLGSGHHLYVADTNNARVQLFTWDIGASTWTYHSKASILSPSSLHLQEVTGGNHTLYVLDMSGSGMKLLEVMMNGHDLNAVDPTTIVSTDIDVDVFPKHINTAITWHPIENQLYAANYRIIARLDDVSDWTNWLGMSTDQFQTAGGVAIDSSGSIYVADTYQHRIMKYAPDGTFQHSFGQVGSGDGEFLRPRGIAVDSAGDIYVADTLNYRVQKFKPDGTFDKKWGVQGEGDGKFRQMNDLIVDAHDYVYVADFKTVQKFDADGSHMVTFGDRLCGTTGNPPCSDPGKVQTASGVGVDSAGNVYISDGTENYLNKFRADGSFEERWGGTGTAVGSFDSPRKIAIDAVDQIHVIDAYNHRIQILQPDGTFLGAFGQYPVTSGIIEDLAFNHTGEFFVLDGNHLNIKVFQARASGPLSDLTAVGDEQSVKLTFSAANGATTVTVKQRETGTTTWIDATTRLAVTASSTEAIVIGLADGTEYEFKLEVTGGPHDGDSNIATAKTIEAAVPITDLAAISGDREITLTFSPLTDATSVKVKIWDPVAAVWVDATTAAPITAGATSTTVIGLADDTYYYFFIEVNGGPHRGYSNTTGASTNPPSGASSTISDLTATGGDRAVMLTFTPPAGATSVTVKQRETGTTTWVDATTVSPITDSSTNAVVTGLLDDTSYEFYLAVVGGSHAGDSNIASARTVVAGVVDTTPPEWPAASELAVSDITPSTVKLIWPQAQDNIAVTGYRIFVDGHQEVDHTVTGFTYSVTDSVYSYTLTGLVPSTTYHFTVKAYDASSNVSEPGLSETATTKARSSSSGRSGGSRSSDTVSANADLSLLEIRTEQGLVKLTPSFKPEIIDYSAETTAVRIRLAAEAHHRKAKVEWQGQTLDDEQVVIELQPGNNVIRLVVQAEDRSSKTYTLTIVRKAPISEGQEAVFRDTAGHWAEQQIAAAVTDGLVAGYPDGTFKPDQPVTRAEFLVMLVRSLQLDGEGAELTFTDSTEIGAWAVDAIRLAVQSGIIAGYSDGSFKPNQSITRAEAAVMIARALQLIWEEDQETSFADNDSIPQWAKGAIETLREQGIVNGRSAHEFVPFASTTRAEAVVMLQRMME